MAYALEMTSLGVMAIALMGCGYWGAAIVGIDGRSIAPVWAQGSFYRLTLYISDVLRLRANNQNFIDISRRSVV